MEERIRLSLVLLVILSGVPALGEEEPAEPNAIALINLTPTEAEAAKELITWEALKLGVQGDSTPLQIPEGSPLEQALRQRLKEADPDSEKASDSPLTLKDLKKILKDGSELEPANAQALVGFLRLQSSGRKLSDPSAKEFLKKAALGEVGRIAEDSPAATLRVPERSRSKLADALKRSLSDSGEEVPEQAKLIERLNNPKDLARALESLDASELSVSDLAELSGGLRTQGREVRGSRFVQDLRDEAQGFLTALRKARRPDPLKQARPLPTFPSGGGSPAFVPNTPVSPPPLVKRNGFGGKGLFSGRHGGTAPGGSAPRGSGRSFRGPGAPGTGTVRLSGNPPRATSLLPSQDGDLDRQIARGHVSLQMRTVYNNNYSVVSACQITAVNEPQPIPNSNNRCSYNMATARHCVEQNGRPFTDIAISPFRELTVTRAQMDNLGFGDLAMLSVEAECRNIPFVPISPTPPREGEGLVVYGTVPLKGQAELNGLTSNLMMMNTNHPDNQGVQVVQGNSGGAVLNEKGQLVGVISSVLLSGGRQVPGIGFFATRNSLEFANAFVNPNFTPNLSTEVASTVQEALQNPVRRTSPDVHL